MIESDPHILATGSLGHVRELARLLGDGGVPSQIMQPPEGCGSS